MQMLTRVTAPAGYPVTLAEAKAHLRVSFSDDDTLIEAYIGAATTAVEQKVGRPLMTQTLRVAERAPEGSVKLRAPLQAITAINYYDPQNVLQTATVSDYLLIADDDSAEIIPGPGVNFPALYPRDDAFRVTFTAGYGTAAQVPVALKQAILLLVGHLYENREAVGQAMDALPMGVDYFVGTLQVKFVG